MKDFLTIEELLDKLEEEGFRVDTAHCRKTVGPSRWDVQVRNALDIAFAGCGGSFREALLQATGNGGAIIGRRSSLEEDRPKKRKRREDLLA